MIQTIHIAQPGIKLFSSEIKPGCKMITGRFICEIFLLKNTIYIRKQGCSR